MKLSGKIKKYLPKVGMGVGVLAATTFICDSSVFAATSNSSMPWATGVNLLSTELSGNLPKIGCVIAVAVSGAMMAFGEMSGMTKRAIQVVFGLSLAVGAGSFVATISNSSSGLIF